MYIDEKLIAIKNNKAYKKQCKWNLYKKKHVSHKAKHFIVNK